MPGLFIEFMGRMHFHLVKNFIIQTLFFFLNSDLSKAQGKEEDYQQERVILLLKFIVHMFFPKSGGCLFFGDVSSQVGARMWALE